MILADTMVWADFIGRGDSALAEMLAARRIVMHPYVCGELALGNLPQRAAFLTDLDLLPPAPVASHDEVMGLIENARLFGTGIGYVDAHLIAATMLMAGGRLWTRDKRMAVVAERLGVAMSSK